MEILSVDVSLLLRRNFFQKLRSPVTGRLTGSSALVMNTSESSTESNGSQGRKLKIVVIGGTGLIGSKVVSLLREQGHEVVAASPSKGVNTLTGEGLAAAMAGAQVVVDVANSPSFEDQAVMDFFTTAGRNIHAAEVAAGVRHHVALSVVGTDRLLASGYFRAKMAQEDLIQAIGIPYTLVRATQFHEFVNAIAQFAVHMDGGRVSPSLFQPIAAAEVSAFVAGFAVQPPVHGIVEIAGPEPISLASAVKQQLQADGDAHIVTEDAAASYFGTLVDDHSLTPAKGAHLGTQTFADWLESRAAVPA